jgi:trans-2,3-dihydro-3-hydroxyanthranilate isomerase
MPSLPLLLVDAFTDRPFAGNACSVVLDAGDLSRELMQAIAREMNQSETAFVLGGTGTRFDVRYYTPDRGLLAWKTPA